MDVLRTADQVLQVLRDGGWIEGRLQLPYPPLLWLCDRHGQQIDAWIRALDAVILMPDITRTDLLPEPRMRYHLRTHTP